MVLKLIIKKDDKWVWQRDLTLSKVAQIVMTCDNFFSWDQCESSCGLYRFCDQIHDVLNAGKATEQKKTIAEKVKEVVEVIKETFEEQDLNTSSTL